MAQYTVNRTKFSILPSSKTSALFSEKKDISPAIEKSKLFMQAAGLFGGWGNLEVKTKGSNW